LDKHLHIVCFDVPYPADYGGVIDVFYRIKALHSFGVQIHLHCFEYGRGRQNELNKYCVEVNYYKRYTGFKGLSITIPYIVKSRANKSLLTALSRDDHPILLEGIHTTYFLFTGDLKHRKVFVRLHNVEFEYYKHLSSDENSFFKKCYYKNESRLLKNYEKKIANAATLLPISKKDEFVYKKLFISKNINYLPAFTNSTSVNIKEGYGKYCLYHGNLTIAENEKSVIWLIESLGETGIPIIIAGKNPSDRLRNKIGDHKNITLIINPGVDKMYNLIQNAGVNILPVKNAAGIKIKLLNALFTGRHCLTDSGAVKGTSLEQYCEIAETEMDFIDKIKKLFEIPFTQTDIEKRKGLLKEFDNIQNAEMLMTWIY